jgi:hypothetical protein
MIAFDGSQFLRAVEELKREVPYEIDKLFSWQEALWVRDIIKKISANPSLPMGQQKQRGEMAVEKDLRRLFAFSAKDGGAHRWDTKNGGMVKTAKGAVVFYDADHWEVSDFKNIHQKNRGSRGRVKKSVGGMTEIDGKMYSNKYLPKQNPALLRYMAEIKSHVGKTKASWLKALDYFNAKSGGLANWTAPSWVTRNKGWGNANGGAYSNFSVNRISGEWAAGSNVPWITERDAASIVNATGATRIRDLKTQNALMRLKKVIEKHNALSMPLESRFGLHFGKVE